MTDRVLTPSDSDLPIRTKMWADEDYAGIDPGIRFAVRVLHSRGIETCQSCQGGDGHAYPVPTVDLLAGPNDAAGFEALSILVGYGLAPVSVAQVWNLDQAGRPYETIWRIVLADARPDLAEKRPMFQWCYQAIDDDPPTVALTCRSCGGLIVPDRLVASGYRHVGSTDCEQWAHPGALGS